MALTKLKRLLEKKTWTGTEVGRAILLSLVAELKKANNPSIPGALSSEDLGRMISGISERPFEYKKYLYYGNAYVGLVELYNYVVSVYQQAQHARYRIGFNTLLTLAGEYRKRNQESLPVIVTQKKLDSWKRQATEDRAGVKLNYLWLFTDCLAYFLGQGDKAPKEFKGILAATEEKEITPEVYFLLAERTPDAFSYYELADGSKEDQFLDNPQEFFRLLEEQIRKHYPEAFKDKSLTFNESIEAYIQEQAGKDSEAWLNVADYRERHSDKLTSYFGVAVKLKKYTGYEEYKKLIGRTTFFDVLSPEDINGAEALTGYEAYISEGQEMAGLKQFTSFRKTLPELASYIDKYIAGFNLASLKGITSRQYGKDIISYAELSEAGVAGYRERLNDISPADIAETIRDKEGGELATRISKAGVAVVYPGFFLNSHKVNEDTGLYPYEQELVNPATVIDIDKQDAEIEANMKFARDNLLSVSLKVLYYAAFVIETIADNTGVKELKELAPGELLKVMEAAIGNDNSITKSLYTLFGRGKEKELELAKRLYPLIDLEQYKPSDKIKEVILEELDKGNGEALGKVKELLDYVLAKIAQDDKGKATYKGEEL